MTENMFPPVFLWPWKQFPCFIHENTTEQTRWGLDRIGLCFWHRVSVRYAGWPRTCSLPTLVSWVAWPLGPDLQDEISFKVSALVYVLHYRLFCLLLFSFKFFYFMCVSVLPMYVYLCARFICLQSILPLLSYAVLIKPRASGMWDRHSTNWATFTAYLLWLSV